MGDGQNRCSIRIGRRVAASAFRVGRHATGRQVPTKPDVTDSSRHNRPGLSWRDAPAQHQQTSPVYVVATIAVLLLWNLAVNLLLPDAGDFAVAASGIVVLLLIAFRSGLDWDQLGLGGGSVGRGIRYGSMAVVIVTAAVFAAALVPASRELLGDDQFNGVASGEMLYEALIRIPLLTALGEELAFRGVLLGLLLARHSPLRAAVLSSALFGLWHVLPGIEALETTTATQLTSGIMGAISVAGQVLVTGLAGMVFAWLRLRSGSLVAPVLAHWGLNGAAYLAGWLIVQNGWA